MTVTLDTNVLISTFIARGACHELLEHCIRRHRVVTSETIMDEFQKKLSTKFGIRKQEVAEAAAFLRAHFDVVTPVPLPEPVSRDPDDDIILATALASASACLITGDKDLLVLRQYAGIPIIAPRAFWAFEMERERPS